MDDVGSGKAEIVGAIRRRWRLMAYVGVTVAVLSVLVAFALPKTYRSIAYFKLRDTSPESIRASFSDQYVYNLRDYVLSESTRRDAVTHMVPYARYREDVETASSQLLKDIHVEMQAATILDYGGHDMTINTGFSVTYANQDPASALAVAQWLADTFVKSQRQEAMEKADQQVKFFAAEAERTGAKVAELEAKVADFRRQNFSALPESAQTNLMVKNQTEQDLQNVERELSAQQQNRIFLSSQLQTAQLNNAGGGLAQLEDEYKRKLTQYDAAHPDMVALRRQIALARKGGTLNADGSLKSELDSKRAELAETRQRYSDEHPDVKRLMSEIKSLEARVAAGEKVDPGAGVANTPAVIQLNSQLHATDTQIGSLQVRRAELQGKLASVQIQLSTSPNVQREYDLLNRDLGTAKQQYEDLLRKRLEIELGQSAIRAGTADKFVLAGRPVLPTSPFSPRRPLIIAVGLLAALMLATGAAVAAETLDSTVRGRRDIGALLGVIPLAAVPEISNSIARKRLQRERSLVTVAAMLGIPIAFFLIRILVR